MTVWNFFFSFGFIRHCPEILYQVGYYSLGKEKRKWNNNNCKAVRARVYHKATNSFFYTVSSIFFSLLQLKIGGVAVHRMHA